MISNDVIGFHPHSKKITLFVGSILLTSIVASHKCYVCGPNNADVNSDSIPSCDRFRPTNSTFIRDCSPETKGCGIQTNGTVLTRTCENIAVHDCKKANNVEYCYCKTELCNKWHPTHDDDEDIDREGSGGGYRTNGHGMIPVITELTGTMVPVTPPIHVTDTIPTDSTQSLHNAHQKLILCSLFVLLFTVTN